jgi:hypothetical protein
MEIGSIDLGDRPQIPLFFERGVRPMDALISGPVAIGGYHARSKAVGKLEHFCSLPDRTDHESVLKKATLVPPRSASAIASNDRDSRSVNG